MSPFEHANGAAGDALSPEARDAPFPAGTVAPVTARDPRLRRRRPRRGGCGGDRGRRHPRDAAGPRRRREAEGRQAAARARPRRPRRRPRADAPPCPDALRRQTLRRGEAAGRARSEPGRPGRLLLRRLPGSSLPALETLGRQHARDSFVALHLGLARFWAGDTPGAVEAWRRADRVQPDTLSALRAEDLLHPSYFPGHPTFVPGFAFPAAIAKLAPPAQFRELERQARNGDADAKILYGIALQKLGRQVSARRAFDRRRACAPEDPEPALAAAVAASTRRISRASFSRLGPLARRFPHAATVRFHLGLLLLWVGQVPEAKTPA